MSLYAGSTELGSAMKSLTQVWDEVREVWTDVMAREFEETFMKDLDGQIRTTLTVMNHVSPILEKAKHDCT
jgi:hypothetical protein